MTVRVQRMTTKIRICLALLAALAALAACSPAPAASTATRTVVPTVVTGTPASTSTRVPAATPTASAVPATATPRPATATARPSQTRAPSATPADTEAATATNTVAVVATPVGSGDFTPTQASIWNTALVGGDNQSGTCSSTANAPYGPMQLTPGDNTLAMHNTVPEDYVLTRIAPNTYPYSGPAAVIEGTLTLDLRFTSATALQMTRTFVSSAEPGCTHVHNYTGTFAR